MTPPPPPTALRNTCMASFLAHFLPSRLPVVAVRQVNVHFASMAVVFWYPSLLLGYVHIRALHPSLLGYVHIRALYPGLEKIMIFSKKIE